MKTCGMCGSATTERRYVILDFDMVSEIITFEDKLPSKLPISCRQLDASAKRRIWKRKTSKFRCKS